MAFICVFTRGIIPTHQSMIHSGLLVDAPFPWRYGGVLVHGLSRGRNDGEPYIRIMRKAAASLG